MLKLGYTYIVNMQFQSLKYVLQRDQVLSIHSDLHKIRAIRQLELKLLTEAKLVTVPTEVNKILIWAMKEEKIQYILEPAPHKRDMILVSSKQYTSLVQFCMKSTMSTAVHSAKI